MNGSEPIDLQRPRIAGADRQRLLVEAAFDLLAEEGLDGLTIRAVLTRTGLARRAFYECFDGKDDLVLAVFEESLSLAARHYGARVADIEGPVERLRFIVVSIVLGQGFSGQDPDAPRDRRGAALSREHMRLAESHPAQLQRALSPLLGLLARELSAGMTLGEVRTCDADRLAVLVYNLVSTTVHTELLAAEGSRIDPVRRRQLATEIWAFCRGAIAA